MQLVRAMGVVDVPRITCPIDACGFVVERTEDELHCEQIELTIGTGTRIDFTSIATADRHRSITR